MILYVAKYYSMLYENPQIVSSFEEAWEKIKAYKADYPQVYYKIVNGTEETFGTY